MDTWSGAGDEVGGFIVFYGRSTTIGFIKNWRTGESCEVMTTCDKLGIGLGGGATAHSLWLFNGPKCGKSLPGVTVGGGAEGGIGGYVSGGPAGTAGASPDIGEGHPLGASGGAGIGAGGAMYGQHCKTIVLSCTNTPCECKDQ